MSNKEEKSKEHKKKNKYIVKDKDGNILPIDIPDEFMDGLRAMLKEEQEKVKKQSRFNITYTFYTYIFFWLCSKYA